MFKSLIAGVLAAVALLSTPLLAQTPVITVAPNSVVFQYTTGGAVPAAQQVVVSSDIPTTITGTGTNYITSGSPGWLSVFPPGPQNTPATLTLSVTPESLPAGTYIAQVNVSTAGAVGAGSTLTVTVFLTVNGTGSGGIPTQTIAAAPTSLNFNWTAGNLAPAPQGVQVTTSDNASFSATTSTNDGKSWITVTPTSSANSGTILVGVNPTGLSGGTYTGVITFTAAFSVVQVSVTLTVSGVGFSSNPASLSFTVPRNYGVSAPQFLAITSIGNLPFQTSVASDGWLQVDLPDGTSPATLQVRANVSNLAEGTYSGIVTVKSGTLTSLDIPVNLTVGPPAPVGVSPGGLTFNYTIGDPIPATQTFRVNSLSSTPQTFTLASSFVSGGNWLNAFPNQNSTSAVVSVQVTPANLTVGTYYGFVTVQPTSITNAAPQPVQIVLTVKAPPPPVILSLNNSASYGALAVSPGQFVTLFGSNIGPKDLTVPPANNFPRTLGNTTVTFDGVQAPFLYASSTQTSVQVPYSVNPNTQTSVVVTYNGLSSTARLMNVIPAYPGLFTSDASGRGQAAALNGDLSLNSAANPVARGGTIVLYGTGEGRTLPASTEGTITPVVQPIPSSQLPISVTIGGLQAQILYAGETPGLVSGLFQINARVPDAVTTGTAPVVVTINGVPSQTAVTVAVK